MHQLKKFCEKKHRGAFQEDELQILLEHTGDINDVTQRSELSKHNHWRVTITDYFGGRGHDYEIGQEVETQGGMMLILTQIPESRREWMQWLGRTARQDKRGQWALILNDQDEPQRSMGNKPPTGVDLSAEVADEFQLRCFEKRDVEMERRVVARNDLANKGKELNRFCDAYYCKKGFSEATNKALFEFFRDNPHHEQGYPMPSTAKMQGMLGSSF